MKPSKIVQITCMEDFDRIKGKSAVKLPNSKTSFEIFLGLRFNPMASCCPGHYEPMTLIKQNGEFVIKTIMVLNQAPENLEPEEKYLTSMYTKEKIPFKGKEFNKYDQIWMEAIRQWKQ